MSILCRDCGMTSVAKIAAECLSCGSKRLVRRDELHELALAHGVRHDMKRYRQVSDAFRTMMLKLTPLAEASVPNVAPGCQ